MLGARAALVAAFGAGAIGGGAGGVGAANLLEPNEPTPAVGQTIDLTPTGQVNRDADPLRQDLPTSVSTLRIGGGQSMTITCSEAPTPAQYEDMARRLRAQAQQCGRLDPGACFDAIHERAENAAAAERRRQAADPRNRGYHRDDIPTAGGVITPSRPTGTLDNMTKAGGDTPPECTRTGPRPATC